MSRKTQITVQYSPLILSQSDWWTLASLVSEWDHVDWFLDPGLSPAAASAVERQSGDRRRDNHVKCGSP